MQTLAAPDIRHGHRPPAALKQAVTAFFVCASLFFAVMAPGRALAACINCECNGLAHTETRQFIREQHVITQEYIRAQFVAFRDVFWLQYFWQQNLLAAMRGMAEQLVTTGMLQVEAYGAMLDAKNQMETQQLMQQMVARAHKDYAPDTEMCTLGTASRGLGSAYRNGILAAHILSKRMQDRQLGNGESLAATGTATDKESRFEQMRNRFCDNEDHFKSMDSICRIKNPAAPGINRDISFMDTVVRPLTLDADFADNNVDNPANAHEQDIFALASNLYNNTSLDFIAEDYFRNPANHPAYLDIRAIVARRNVAEYSFDSIVGMKTGGRPPAEDVGEYLAKIYTQLGFDDPDARTMVGQRPSYNALMEIMNKTLYLRPEFYINLYTKPANIQRIGATIQAANLMQDMDDFNSQLRTEMNLSQILESELAPVQESIQNDINRIRGTGAVEDRR
jgi:hypothetical protein